MASIQPCTFFVPLLKEQVLISPFSLACSTGNLSLVELLFPSFAVSLLSDTADEEMLKPLHMAILSKNLSLVHFLLDSFAATVHEGDRLLCLICDEDKWKGRNCFHYASEAEFRPTFLLLLSYVQPLLTGNNALPSSLLRRQSNQEEDILDSLVLPFLANVNREGTKQEQEARLQRLLSVLDEAQGFSPLHVAVYFRSTRDRRGKHQEKNEEEERKEEETVVELLLRMGVNANFPTERELDSALHIAVRKVFFHLLFFLPSHHLSLFLSFREM